MSHIGPFHGTLILIEQAVGQTVQMSLNWSVTTLKGPSPYTSPMINNHTFNQIPDQASFKVGTDRCPQTKMKRTVRCEDVIFSAHPNAMKAYWCFKFKRTVKTTSSYQTKHLWLFFNKLKQFTQKWIQFAYGGLFRLCFYKQQDNPNFFDFYPHMPL